MSVTRRLRRVLGQDSAPGSREGAADARARHGGQPATRQRAWAETVPEPPPVPAGWHTGPPDFVVLGAQKAGTTWWFRLIAAHPGVHQPEEQRPELHFFDRLYDRWPGPEEIARYHRYFPRPDGVLVGEKTPDYLDSYWVPRMLAEAAPDAHVIAILRDPVERYISGIAHEAQRLASAGLEPGWFEGRRATIDAYQRGFYASQLRTLADAFPPERTLVLQYEACVRDPAGLLARTYAFLGLPPHALTDEQLVRPRNRTTASKPELEPERRRLLVQAYEEDARDLLALVPDLDLSLWPDLAHLAGPAREVATTGAAASPG